MRLLTLLAALAISTGPVVAQTPAVKSPNTNNPAAPVPGANSFTEGQAKSKIEFAGLHECFGPEEGRQRNLDRLRHQGRKQGQCPPRLPGQRHHPIG